MSYDHPPRHEWIRLTEFVSARGNRYFAGYVGGLKFVLLADPDAEPARGGIMSWILSVQPSPNGLRPAERRTSPLPDQPGASSSPPQQAGGAPEARPPETSSPVEPRAPRRRTSGSQEARARAALEQLDDRPLNDEIPF
ncbi:hypothetical protein [Chelatococcus sp. XZ-Ab1]|uniref:hypothetical protein n=1 Tax=Chelatococcus sp. XZ-Ab1 TaxID=3034027 RepID=UPI0023E3D7FF|nr:hypothetical protein [Chelatococcus sp. XZ-Ab1]